MSEFDDDTALERGSDGTWRGEITDRWSIGAGPNGGYIAAILTRALLGDSPFSQPLTMTVHYVSRPVPGPVRVTVEKVRVGRSHATLLARMAQNSEVAVALATTGRLRPDEPTSIQATPPEYPPPEECMSGKGPSIPGLTFRQRFATRVASADDLAFLRTAPGPAATGGWTRLADGRALDVLAVPLFMDSWPPAMFSTFMGGNAPTIELTVHWRAQAEGDWHLARFSSRFLTGGYVEEDGELWDRSGVLVAQSRQLARFIRPAAT